MVGFKKQFQSISKSFEGLPDEGLYLLLPDGQELSLHRDNVESCAQKMWDDPDLIPPPMKKDLRVLRCGFCSETNGMCNSLRIILPQIQILHKYQSFDKVNVAIKTNERITYYPEIEFQRALMFLVNMSFLNYCTVTRNIGPYLEGATALMSPMDIAKLLVSNVLAKTQGDMKAAKQVLVYLSSLVDITTHNKLDRLAQLTKSDVISNAMVNFALPFRYIFTLLPHENVSSITVEEYMEEDLQLERYATLLTTSDEVSNDQHDELLLMLKELKKEDERPIEEFCTDMDVFYKHVEQHFKDEEVLFKPGDEATAHIAQHKHFLLTVQNSISDLRKGGKLTQKELVLYCTSWLFEHLIGMDQFI